MWELYLKFDNACINVYLEKMQENHAILMPRLSLGSYGCNSAT